MGTTEGFPGGSSVKNLPAKQETQIWFLGQEEPLEKEMATCSTILAWGVPWTEEPGGLQSMGSQRVGHNLAMKQPPQPTRTTTSATFLLVQSWFLPPQLGWVIASNLPSGLEWWAVSELPLGPSYCNSIHSAGQEPMWGLFQLLSISNPIKHSEPMKIITVWVGRLNGHLWNGLGPRLHLSPSVSHPLLTRSSWWWFGFSNISISSNPGPKTSWDTWVLPFLQCWSLRRTGTVSSMYSFWVFVGFSARGSSLSLSVTGFWIWELAQNWKWDEGLLHFPRQPTSAFWSSAPGPVWLYKPGNTLVGSPTSFT